jgi:hypothetical protein
MGTKIKPSFRSDYAVVSEGWHLFRIVEPKIDLIAKEDQKESKDGIINDKNFVVRNAVEGGDEDGVELQEFFASHSKKEFALSRLSGLMIKTEVIPMTEEIDVDTMRTEKFETKFKMALPKRLFGGKVKHSKGQKKEGSEEHNIFANIIEYATVKEYNDMMAAKTTAKPKESKENGKSKTGETEKTTTQTEKDPWA